MNTAVQHIDPEQMHQLDDATVKVEIGTRWTPEHVVRLDTQTGMFCEVNSPVIGQMESLLQRALIEKPGPRRVPWILWWFLIASAAVLAATWKAWVA